MKIRMTESQATFIFSVVSAGIMLGALYYAVLFMLNTMNALLGGAGLDISSSVNLLGIILSVFAVARLASIMLNT